MRSRFSLARFVVGFSILITGRPKVLAKNCALNFVTHYPEFHERHLTGEILKPDHPTGIAKIATPTSAAAITPSPIVISHMRGPLNSTTEYHNARAV